MLSVSRPIEVLELKDWVPETKVTGRLSRSRQRSWKRAAASSPTPMAQPTLSRCQPQVMRGQVSESR
jgi:hypothetical protein